MSLEEEGEIRGKREGERKRREREKERKKKTVHARALCCVRSQ